jgi:hypothetical protein
MSDIPSSPKQVVGVQPWQPWPLSAWPWWTEPVRAERLAMLRIGIALVLLWDIGYHYAPHLLTYFGKDELGSPTVFNWYFQAPRTTWSLLRGVGHEAGLYLALLSWLALTFWIVGNAVTRMLLHKRELPPDDRSGVASVLWTVTFTWYVAGVWAHLLDAEKVTALAWFLPLVGFSLACLFFTFDLMQRLVDGRHRPSYLSGLFALFMTGPLLFHVGLRLVEVDRSTWWSFLLKPWQDSEAMMQFAMAMWIFSAFLLLIGKWTTFAAIATWVLSVSFANTNHYLENAGDTIRLILLLYVMLSPAGAAWSVDAWFSKRTAPVYVHPWPLRLIFVQMIFIYFMNGLYKLFGDEWMEGRSLYFVLGDLALARFSVASVPIPFVLTQLMTWSVLVWEVTFPFLLIFKWTRIPALIMGVLFHLGIFATMELGPFVPYALCMYLPLIPWERLRRERVEDAAIAPVRMDEPRPSGSGVEERVP